ncbi:ATP-dependent Lon protease, partial [Candidatus Hakubella thermalkaliphila]
VKEQLKKMGGIEYWDTTFSYFDDTEERFISVPEQTSVGMIPTDPQLPGTVFTVGYDVGTGKICLFRVEVGIMKGTGKYKVTGAVSMAMKEAIRTAYDYLRVNISKFAVDKSLEDYDIHVQVVNLMQAKEGTQTGVAYLVGILSALLAKQLHTGSVVMGEMSIHGVMMPVNALAECLQVVRENGGERVLLPAANAKDLSSVPPDILSGLDISFFSEPIECVLKAVELR